MPKAAWLSLSAGGLALKCLCVTHDWNRELVKERHDLCRRDDARTAICNGKNYWWVQEGSGSAEIVTNSLTLG
jgi:hypothetical protein